MENSFVFRIARVRILHVLFSYLIERSRVRLSEQSEIHYFCLNVATFLNVVVTFRKHNENRSLFVGTCDAPIFHKFHNSSFVKSKFS